MARTDQDKKEIFRKWNELINMNQKSLDSWAKDEDRLLASINRSEAKQEGGIQSGYDSFHRIKRRKGKKFEDWTSQDFDNASQEIGFNSRMIGGKPGDTVEESGMSKWEISLKNWGHDPSLKSSPAHSKWKSWKQKHASVEAINKEFQKSALIRVARKIEVKRQVIASMEETEKKSLIKRFLGWLVLKLKKFGRELPKQLFIPEIQAVIRDLIKTSQDKVQVPIPKTTSEKALFKASKVLGINRLIANVRDIYVADTAESFDNLSKVAGGSLYDEIIEKMTYAESDLLESKAGLSEELIAIREDMSKKSPWYNSKLDNAIEYLKTRIGYLYNRAAYYGTVGNILYRKAVIKLARTYESLMFKLSEVKDSKIYGVKLLMIAVKVGAIAAVYGLLWKKMTLWQASKYFFASGKASLGLIIVKQIIPTFLATGSFKVTASSVRKAGIMLGVIPLHVFNKFLDLADFLAYLAKTGYGWVVDRLKAGWDKLPSLQRTATEEIRAILRRAHEDPIYKRQLLLEYKMELRKCL
jgi:hypothetical protein